ncbi:unnamed protein product, partial [Medioppia subpectinata]
VKPVLSDESDCQIVDEVTSSTPATVRVSKPKATINGHTSGTNGHNSGTNGQRSPPSAASGDSVAADGVDEEQADEELIASNDNNTNTDANETRVAPNAEEAQEERQMNGTDAHNKSTTGAADVPLIADKSVPKPSSVPSPSPPSVPSRPLNKQFQCCVCDQLCDNKREVTDHVRSIHPNTPIRFNVIHASL